MAADRKVPAKRVDVVRLRLVREGSFLYANRRISKPADAAEIMRDWLEDAASEEFWAICLDCKNAVLAIAQISIGDLSSAIVHPRSVFQVGLMTNAASIILCHNHPSGDPAPSREDSNVTNRLREAGKLLGIEILDHLVIGSEGRFVSLRETAWARSGPVKE